MSFDLKRHTILLTVAGSRAYGTHTDTSDLDMKGVCVPPRNFYLGIDKFEQADKPGTVEPFLAGLPENLRAVAEANGAEGTVYEVRRFLDLASGANPNILDVLFCRDEDVLLTTPEGDLLRANREAFLTKKCLMTFVGYADAQFKRIAGHRRYLFNPPDHAPTREEYGLATRAEMPQDQIMAAMALVRKKVDSWSIDFVGMDEATKIFIQDQIEQMLAEIEMGTDVRYQAAGRLLGYEDNFMQLIDNQRRYDQAVREWSSFHKWKVERNKKRAALETASGFDTKHAMHLVRLILAAEEIFTYGRLSVHSGQVAFLNEIRTGKHPYQWLVAWFQERRMNLAKIAAHSSLPDRVDQKWLGNLAQGIVESRLGL